MRSAKFLVERGSAMPIRSPTRPSRWSPGWVVNGNPPSISTPRSRRVRPPYAHLHLHQYCACYNPIVMRQPDLRQPLGKAIKAPERGPGELPNAMDRLTCGAN